MTTNLQRITSDTFIGSKMVFIFIHWSLLMDCLKTVSPFVIQDISCTFPNQIQSISPNSVRILRNTDQKISKYGHISRSEGYTFSYWLLFFTSWLFFLISFSILTGNFFIVIFWYSFSSIVYNILQLISPFTNQDITEEFVIIWRKSKIINPLNASVALK